jgi:hypothetical protein
LKTWQAIESSIRELILKEDPDHFLRWDPILKTMFTGGRVARRGYTGIEVGVLKSSEEWERWKSALREDPVGNPFLWSLRPATSGNLIHGAYHLARFSAVSGERLEDCDVVFEFGGGYGSMRRLFAKLGFKGAYILFDFPLLIALQRFFLESLGLKVVDNPHELEPGQTLVVSSIEQLEAAIGSARGRRGFIATWSLSESPAELQLRIVRMIREFDEFLIGYRERFRELDNRSGLDNWLRALPDVDWTGEAIAHLPTTRYLFGHRTSR